MADRCIRRGTRLDSFKVLQRSLSPELANLLAGTIFFFCKEAYLVEYKIDSFILNEMREGHRYCKHRKPH